MRRRRNVENVGSFHVPGARVTACLYATICRAVGDLEACSNKIASIFAPGTFLHNQGQPLPFAANFRDPNPCPQYCRFPAMPRIDFKWRFVHKQA
jgi:hypothetical protein